MNNTHRRACSIAICTLSLVAVANQGMSADPGSSGISPDTEAQHPAHDTSLIDQMQQLSGGSNSEKFYVVQPRRSGNAGVFDIAGGVGYNANSDVNVRSSEAMARVSYHATDNWFLSLAGSQVRNQFSLSAQRRISDDGVYPDVGFVKSRYDATVGYNLIYGKARVSKDSVFYFDQYIALGAGQIEQSNTRETSKTPAMVADIGATFWFAQRVSLAIGAKTYRFKETRIASDGIANHVIAYGNIGMLLGGAG